MPEYDALTAARFSITIDGYEVGSFAEIYAATTPGAPARKLQPHELSHVCQQPGSARTSRISNRSAASLVIKRGVCDQGMIRRWQMGATRAVALVVHNSAGQHVVRWKLIQARPMKIVEEPARSKGGNTITVEEITIVHEGIDID